MINGNVNEFVENLYYGTENIFIFRRRKYMIQGWWNNNTFWMGLQQWEPTNEGYVWDYIASTSAECVEQFLQAPLFDGKTFWEAEQEIEWVDD